MSKLYSLQSVAAVPYRGKVFPDITIYWFVDQRKSPHLDCASYIKNYDPTDDNHYAEQALQEYFKDEEAALFIEWLRSKEGVEATLEEAELPIPSNSMGFGAIPAGGGADFLEVYRTEGYTLPFKVVGYYSVW